MKKILILFSTLFLLSTCGKKTESTRPERMDLVETVFASGTLEPRNKYNLTAQTDGYILRLDLEAGDTVKKDQLIAVIDNKSNSINASGSEQLLRIASINAGPGGPSIEQARQNSNLARQKMVQDSIQFKRYEKLVQSNSVSKLEFENTRLNFESSRTNFLNSLLALKQAEQLAEQQLITARSQRDVSSVSGDNNELRALMPGRIYKLLKEKGDFVRRGEVIAVLGDSNNLYARLSIDENNIGHIKTGQEAIIQFNTNKEKNYKGKISKIFPAFDEPTQSFYCEADFIENIDFKIAGTQLQANIITKKNKQALVIPKKFLDYGNKVKLENGDMVEVKTGFISGEYVEILGGINDSTVIVLKP
jgi:HlyD family secretion protein